MCFSASASLIAGVLLSAIGVATIKKTRRREEIPLAAIPLLFGIQQFIEGMLWLSFRFEIPLLNSVMTYAFTFFSHVLWPIFVPFAILMVETGPWRRKIIWVFQITGAAVGLYLLYYIARHSISSEIHGHVIYVFPHFHKPLVLMLYVTATCAGAFFSSHKTINLFGFMSLFLFVVAYWFYKVAFFSVWCFFAAILSAIIYLHFKSINARKPEVKLHGA
jgi:hypothetical protein